MKVYQGLKGEIEKKEDKREGSFKQIFWRDVQTWKLERRDRIILGVRK